MKTEQSSLSHLPEEDRPRERLKKHGVTALSAAELLAIILGNGTKGKSVLMMATELLTKFGSLESLAQATLSELCQVRGLGPAKAIQLMAAFGIGNRLAEQQGPQETKVRTPAQAYSVVRSRLQALKKEVFLLLMLDTKATLIAQEMVSMGTLSRTPVHPREVFYPAIRHHAASLILAHNHPSGDPTPSEADRQLTDRLVHAAKIIGIPINDHIIVGSQGYVSLREYGHAV